MSTNVLTNVPLGPSLFDDLIKPWNEFFENRSVFTGRIMKVPSVNIVENKNNYIVSLAAPGFKKEDFIVEVDDNQLTIRSEKEERKENEDERISRMEYNYTSFSRSFTLPDDVKQDAVEANYFNGELKITIPKKDEVSRPTLSKHVVVK